MFVIVAAVVAAVTRSELELRKINWLVLAFTASAVGWEPTGIGLPSTVLVLPSITLTVSSLTFVT